MEGPFGRSSETPDSGLEGPFSFGRSFGDPRSEGRRPPILEGPFWKVLWSTPILEGPFESTPILEGPFGRSSKHPDPGRSFLNFYIRDGTPAARILLIPPVVFVRCLPVRVPGPAVGAGLDEEDGAGGVALLAGEVEGGILVLTRETRITDGPAIEMHCRTENSSRQRDSR